MKPLYKVIERETPIDLAQAVNESIADDYVPTGGVAVAVAQLQDRDESWSNYFYYSQAMVRRDLL